MAALGWSWTAGASLLALLALGLYTRGWRRLRVAGASLAHPARLAALVVGTLWIWAALAGPLALWSQQYYLARMGQKVALCLIGAPLLWLGAPFHIIARGLPARARSLLARTLVRPHRLTPTLQASTNPGIAWFAYISVFLLWHDPGLADWSMQTATRQQVLLVLLLAAALLFWQQVTRSGPRLYARARPLARFAMLVAVEVPNVIAGITITFKTTPLYSYYANLSTAGNYAGNSAASQQSLGGALTWIFGTLVYVVSIVLVVNEVFQAEGIDRPQPVAGWDSEERFIAPGLEGRIGEPGFERHDWRK
jgi:cytochrome c oxidase assembly factor CtaG